MVSYEDIGKTFVDVITFEAKIEVATGKPSNHARSYELLSKLHDIILEDNKPLGKPFFDPPKKNKVNHYLKDKGR